MTRKRGTIENPDWADKNKNNDIQDQEQNLINSEPDEADDFLTRFLRERNALIEPQPSQAQNEKQDKEQNKEQSNDLVAAQSSTSEEKSIWEQAMEELNSDEEYVGQKSPDFSEKLKGVIDVVVPFLKRAGDIVLKAIKKMILFIKEKWKASQNKKTKGEKTGSNSKGKTASKNKKDTVKVSNKKKTKLPETESAPMLQPTIEIVTKTITGTVDIIFMGSDAGIGTTYTAFLCASALKKKYKVCVLELNSSGHFAEIFEFLNQEIPYKRRMYRYSGVDYYFGIQYEDFLAEFRTKYDFVIIDMGDMRDIRDYTQIQLCDYVFVLARGNEWRLKHLLKIYEIIQTKDKAHRWTLLFPLISINKEIKKICRFNRVEAIPYSTSPYEADRQTAEKFYTLLGLKFKRVRRPKI